MNIYFRHPNVKFRPEAWGGVVQTASGVYVLDEEHYKILANFIETETDVPSPIFQTLLDIGAVCSISKKEAMAISDE